MCGVVGPEMRPEVLRQLVFEMCLLLGGTGPCHEMRGETEMLASPCPNDRLSRERGCSISCSRFSHVEFHFEPGFAYLEALPWYPRWHGGVWAP